MPVRRSTVGPAGGYDGVEVALRSASGFAGALCGFVPRSSGQRGSEGVWRPAEMGLALERWRQWTVGPGHGVFRLPALGFLPRCHCGSAVFSRGPCDGIWIPFSWWRVLAAGGAILSLLLMAAFFGPTKLLPMALDLVVLWAALTNWLQPAH